MKFHLKLSLILLVAGLSLAGQDTGRQSQDSGCEVVVQALKDSQEIKNGNVRWEVERKFERDGGGQFPTSTRYVYKQCHYLHLDVEFDPKAVPGRLFSPEDVVARTSKLYVDSSAKD
jgi:hypothetical protein